MTERRLKKTVVYGLYGLAFIAIIAVIYILEVATTKGFKDDNTYVNKTIIENDTPVVSTGEVIKRPYQADGISLIKNFYDYKSEEENQQNSLIYYDGTYLQNSGVDYSKNGEVFEVVSIYDGTVSNVTENTVLGKTIEITHENGVVSVYQSLSEVNVTINEVVNQGQVIGKSGVSNIDKDLQNHLHFELIVKGINVNPEIYYDKKLSEISNFNPRNNKK